MRRSLFTFELSSIKSIYLNSQNYEKNHFSFTCFYLCCSDRVGAKKAVSAITEKFDCQPLLSTATIREFLRGKTLKDVPENDGGNETEWTFDSDELIELDVIETKLTKAKAVSVVSLKTSTRAGLVKRNDNGGFDGFMELSGRLRLNFELIAGEWELLKIKNISAKYSEFELQIVDN